jgi:hypothetical protein
MVERHTAQQRRTLGDECAIAARRRCRSPGDFLLQLTHQLALCDTAGDLAPARVSSEQLIDVVAVETQHARRFERLLTVARALTPHVGGVVTDETAFEFEPQVHFAVVDAQQ